MKEAKAKELPRKEAKLSKKSKMKRGNIIHEMGRRRKRETKNTSKE